MDTLLISTWVFAAAVLSTLAGIIIYAQNNAAPARPMGRLLHDPSRRDPG